MPPYEYKITAKADPEVDCGWVVEVWMRSTDRPGELSWRRVIVTSYASDLRDEARPFAVFKRMVRCLT
jgi:hypothetical protein